MTTPAQQAESGSQGSALGAGRLLSHGARANPDGRMPLLEHIRELRNRVFKAILAMCAGAIGGWFLYPYVWNFIERPYCKLRIPNAVTQGKGCQLYVNGLFDAFFLHLQLAIVIGIILSSPLWMYQLWAFIAPGLYRRERRWAYYFAGSAFPLFAIGGTIAYFAMTKGLRFLIGQVPHHVVPLITISTYLSYAELMLVIFGIAFELPLAVVLLNLTGILTHQRFRKWRRMIIFVIFAFAAVMTPSPDPISMLLLAVPCVLLVEAAEVFAYLHDRRKARRLASYPGLSPEEVAAYGLDETSGDGADIGRSGD
jgi:sec-independent protein translocase protein TatC